ncbi:MAG TPA: hypothetical protein VFH56_17160 [Acidimicrobiales bacterium]|nr:hypothetical protein [Acidimicrobiales bacterium]
MISHLKDLFRSLATREQSKRATAKARYLGLVAEAVRGKAIDPADAEEALNAAGRSVHDFETDVRAGINRTELRATVARAKAARQKLAVLNIRAAAAEEQFVEAQHAFAAASAEIEAERGPLEQFVASVMDAEKQLIDSCPDDSLLLDFRAASRRAAEIGERLTEARRELADVEADARRVVRKADAAMAQERREQRTGWEERLARLAAVAADPQAFLRRKREPPVKAAAAQLADAQRRKAELVKRIMEA